jgi:dihydrofolate synthase/folylpolyglutamate synthase
MQELDPRSEQEFFAIFQDYFNLETNTARRYTSGEYSLERMQPIAAAAGHPERELRIVHIAGTKGKGSTTHFVAALLASAGRSCGTFTSPHLVTVRERFQVNNRLLPYDEIIKAARKLEARLRQQQLEPSLFEIMTVLALRIFAEHQCEFAVLETGIGGTLDSTNYIPDPVCCAITSVSLDHTQLLGESVEEIASQKAGIIKAGVPVIIARQPFSQAERVLKEAAASRQAPVLQPAGEAELASWPVQHLPAFLQDNFRTALAICQRLALKPDPAKFEMPALRGRCECLRKDPLVIIDSAHNADSADKLVDSLILRYPQTRFTVVLGVVRGKDTAGIMKALARLQADFILTNPCVPHKGSELDTLVKLADSLGCRYLVIPEIGSLRQLPETTPLLFTGSFFTALIGARLFDKP